MGDRTLDYVALAVLCFVVLTIIYGIIYIHDIPYEMAKKRNHPHQDAIHTAGWVSLFLMHTIWPFLWIWATIYKPGVGWGLSTPETLPPEKPSAVDSSSPQTEELTSRLDELETQLKTQQANHQKQIRQISSYLKKLKKQLNEEREE